MAKVDKEAKTCDINTHIILTIVKQSPRFNARIARIDIITGSYDIEDIDTLDKNVNFRYMNVNTSNNIYRYN